MTGEQEATPDEDGRVTNRGRRRRSIPVFLAGVAGRRVVPHANAGNPHAAQSGGIPCFVELRRRHTGEFLAELFFASQFTTR